MTDAKRQQDLGLRETGSLNNVEEHRFEPIKGYPMLQWRGKRPFTSTVYYPAQHRETYGEAVDGWRNRIYWGDNLQVMSHLLKEFRGAVQLVYIDPPFDSKADYKKTVSIKGGSASNDHSVFEEKQYTDIWSNDEYLQFMYERLILIRELLTENGSIYLHCDQNRGHYLQAIMDELFGRENFQNQIIWKRTGSHNSAKRYGPIHDIILFYSKKDTFTWNSVYSQYEDEYIKRFSYSDDNGRKFQPISLIAAGTRSGSTGKVWRGIDVTSKGNHWRYTIEKLDQLDTEGKIFWPSDDSLPRLKHYLDEAKGYPAQDLWLDIPAINSQASERIGYPTQKPEALLERLIQASSNPGDIVFDCFMGSGTTQAVAMRLGRRFIGADINLGAVQTTTKRLVSAIDQFSSKPFTQSFLKSESDLVENPEDIEPTPNNASVFYKGFDIYNVNHYDIFRNPIQAKEILLEALEVNRLQAGQLFDGEKDGRMVKVMPINRIATRQDLNELINGFDYKAFERRQAERPTQAVERITLICMGHESALAAHLQQEVPYKLDIEVIDILRDKQDIQFKRDAEARVVIKDGQLVIERFYPMNLLAKLSMDMERVTDWRELVESVMIDWNYDGAVLQPTILDIPEDSNFVAGYYPIPDDAGTIRIKITDLLSESLEVEVRYG